MARSNTACFFLCTLGYSYHFAVRILRGVLAAVAAIIIAVFVIVFVVTVAIAFVLRSTTLGLLEIRVQTLALPHQWLGRRSMYGLCVYILTNDLVVKKDV